MNSTESNGEAPIFDVVRRLASRLRATSTSAAILAIVALYDGYLALGHSRWAAWLKIPSATGSTRLSAVLAWSTVTLGLLAVAWALRGRSLGTILSLLDRCRAPWALLVPLAIFDLVFVLGHTRVAVSLNLTLLELGPWLVGSTELPYLAAVALLNLVVVVLAWRARTLPVSECPHAAWRFLGAASAGWIFVCALAIFDVGFVASELRVWSRVRDCEPLSFFRLVPAVLLNFGLLWAARRAASTSVDRYARSVDEAATSSEASLQSATAEGRLAHPYLTIAASVIVAHGLLLLNDGLYFEDICFYDWLGREPDLLFMVSGIYGHFLPMYLIEAIYNLPHNVFAFKAAVFTCILLSSFLTYDICNVSGLLGQGRSVMVAVLSALYPAHLATPLINISFNYPPLLLFLCAVRLSLCAAGRSRPTSWLVTSFALVFFFYSFILNSLLVLYAGFLVFHLIYTKAALGVPWPRSLRNLLQRYWHFAAVPVAFWLYRSLALPPYGEGVDHLRLRPGLSGLIGGYVQLLWVVADQLVVVVLNPVWLVPCIAVAAGCFFMIRPSAHVCLREQAPLRKIALFGVLLFLLGAFPYVVTGREFDSDFESRNRLLLGIPIALLLVAGTSLCFRRSDWGFIVLWAIVATCGIYRVRTYILYEADAIKNHSVVRKLRQMEDARSTHLFAIRDTFVRERVCHPQGPTSLFLHPTNTLSYVFGDFRRFGINEFSDGGTPTRWLARAFAMTASNPISWYSRKDVEFYQRLFRNTAFFPLQFDPDRPQATLTVERQSRQGDAALVLRYYYDKFLDPDRIAPLLDEVTQVTLMPRDRPASHERRPP